MQTLRTLLVWSLNSAASGAANCDGTLIPEGQWLHLTKVSEGDWKMRNCFAARGSGVLLNQWGKEIQQNPQAYSTRLRTSSKSNLHLWKIEGILPITENGLSCWSINSFRRLYMCLKFVTSVNEEMGAAGVGKGDHLCQLKGPLLFWGCSKVTNYVAQTQSTVLLYTMYLICKRLCVQLHTSSLPVYHQDSFHILFPLTFPDWASPLATHDPVGCITAGRLGSVVCILRLSRRLLTEQTKPPFLCSRHSSVKHLHFSGTLAPLWLSCPFTYYQITLTHPQNIKGVSFSMKVFITKVGWVTLGIRNINSYWRKKIGFSFQFSFPVHHIPWRKITTWCQYVFNPG